MENFKFEDLKYERIDFKAYSEMLKEYTDKMKKAGSYEEARGIFLEADKHFDHAMTTFTIAHIRHTLNTADEFYEAEVQYCYEQFPLIEGLSVEYNDTIYDSPFRADFEKEFGAKMFSEMELAKKSYCEANIPLKQRDAVLCDEYQKIIASAQIEFDGKKLNLYGIMKYSEHEDREVRRAAAKAYSDFYHSNEARLEEIWAELISVRNEMGRNLGFDNYIPLGYMGQGRTDYGREEVESFRKQVEEELVPFCSRLYELQKKRIGVDDLYFYDEKVIFSDGNAVPAGDDEFMIEQARDMYHKLSPETAEFIDFMIEHQLMDLQNKPGKASTGYMTELPDYKAPYVFSCFNQTIFDMQVLTHELGHAFAGYRSMRETTVSNQRSLSTDIAEIHSMAMEQFAYPYAEQFFGSLADKFRLAHLQEAITFVPFGVAVDEFQHICYENPELSPKERTLEWKKLEEKYMPWRKYDADDFFDRGGYWYHKIHIYLYPFYYINYTLTTMGAMEFKKKDHENHEKAWEDYMKLCNCGGKYSYLETLKLANVSNPFAAGSVKTSMSYAKEELLAMIDRVQK